MVGDSILRPCPDKLPGILNAERSFLGLVGFYRSFIPRISEVAPPLSELAKKAMKNQLKWEKPREEAFQKLRKVLTAQPILKIAGLSKPYIIQFDISEIGLGAVFLQEENAIKTQMHTPVAN